MKTSYSHLTMPNGMRVLLIPRSGTEALTVFVYCKVGSRNESKPINGASHFMEHLMFKGTERRPTTLEISQELEGIGAEFNAYTSKEHTGYYIKAEAKHLPTMIDVLEDMLFHSLYQTDEIERERKVIIEEIKMYEENPLMHIEDLGELSLYGATPLGRSIAGPVETIARVSRSSLLQYRKSYYQPANMLLAIAGKLPSNAVTLIRKAFQNKKNEHRIFRQKLDAKTRKHAVVVQKKETKQAQLAILFPAFHHNHKDLPALEVMSIILGGSMSSRLFIQIRERLGLCYYIKASTSTYQDTGALEILTGVSSTSFPMAVKAIMKELTNMAAHPVTMKELTRAKEFLRGKFVLSMESSERLAQWFGQEALFMRNIKRPEERLKELQEVTVKDIRRVAARIIDPKTMSVAAIGPFTQASVSRLFGIA